MTRSAFSDDKPNDAPVESRNLSMTMIVILVVGVFSILLVWGLRPAQYVGLGATHPSVGHAMGSFQLEPLVGDPDPVTLASLRGNVVLINFWGTWCGPCMSEFPQLVKMNDRLKSDKRFRFVPVAVGPGGAEVPGDELQAATQEYLAKLKADLDVYRDPQGGTTMSLMRAAQLPKFVYPTTVLLDQDGTIQGLWQGYQAGLEDDMEASIKTLLKS